VHYFPDIPLTFSKWANQYGGIYKVWTWFQPQLVISDPEHLQVFFTSSKILDRSRIYEAGHDALGKGSIFVANGKPFFSIEVS